MREIKFRVWDNPAKYMETDWSKIGNALKSLCDNPRFKVLEYTGLKDKNGKKIFEGDIVDLDSWDGIFQIRFIEGAFCLCNENEEFVADIHYVQHAGIKQAEVIGNIFENIELFGG